MWPRLPAFCAMRKGIRQENKTPHSTGLAQADFCCRGRQPATYLCFPSFPVFIMHIRLESPQQDDVIALIAELDQYQDSLYPPEARYALDLSSLAQENVIFVVARNPALQAIACAALVLGPSAGELKRMYVLPEYRSQGVAGLVLNMLEAQARQRGCHLLQLETGPLQEQALAFYEKNGFQRCGPFGDYPDHPLSVFMQKEC